MQLEIKPNAFLMLFMVQTNIRAMYIITQIEDENENKTIVKAILIHKNGKQGLFI